MAVEASAIQQLAVRAMLDETPTVQDENEVGSLDAREPMGADENRPAPEMGAEPVQDQLLGLGGHTRPRRAALGGAPGGGGGGGERSPGRPPSGRRTPRRPR